MRACGRWVSCVGDAPLSRTPTQMQIKNIRARIRAALKEARWRARWRAHDASVAVEEDLVWKGTDAVFDLAERTADSSVGRGAGRVRALIDRRLVWPLTDRLSEQSDLVRTALGTAAVAVALAAVWGGAMLASGGEEATAEEPMTMVEATGAAGETLEGVSPNFTSSQSGAGEPVPAEKRPADPVGRTAWDFAQAFVLYEVCNADEAADDFERLATPALADSLKESPPRLPKNVKVPEARVLNVVVGEPDGKLVDASVSMVRLEAVSELRLTLTQERESWRVKEIRG